MGKKRTRKTVVSKGQRRNIVAGVKEVRQDRGEGEKAYNKLKAWRKGQNPWITVPGTQTNKRFIKVRANAVYGDPKRASYGIYGKPSTNE
jgi:hypothetical protein